MNAPAKVKPPVETVYQKIAAVQAALAKVGIGKTRQNETPGQNYKFRGIDEIYNTLAPMMAEHGLCVLPRIVEHELTARGTTSRGNTIWSAVVTAEFDFVSADDGSIHVVRTMGEAMDSSDKATNKAMSAAYKYAALMTFAIPTEGDNDADAHTHEVVAPAEQPKPAKRAPQHSALKTELRGFVHELNGCGDADQLNAFLKTPDALRIVRETREKLPHLWDGNDWPEGLDRPEEFVPLAEVIDRRTRECAEATARYLQA